jgi:hypothetical protein
MGKKAKRSILETHRLVDMKPGDPPTTAAEKRLISRYLSELSRQHVTTKKSV